MSTETIYFKVQVVNPEKIGSGLKAYLRYSVKTETNSTAFQSQSFEVQRRFSEFHALYETLVDKHRDKGLYIPHVPEKSFTASTKVKALNKDLSENFQVEQRRHSLETFMNRLLRIEIFQKDELVIHFITAAIATAKARDNLLKLKTNVSSTFSSMIPETSEYGLFYEEKAQRVLLLESSLQQLQNAGLDIYSVRKDLINSYRSFSSSINNLSSIEQNESVATFLNSISDLKEKAAEIQSQQCINDSRHIVGLNKDFLGDIISLKHLFRIYAKKFNELKQLGVKIDRANEKLPMVQASGTPLEVQNITKEIEEMTKLKEFKTASLSEYLAEMEKSFDMFEEIRFDDTKASTLKYLKDWYQCQGKLLSLWEGLLPKCQEIN